MLIEWKHIGKPFDPAVFFPQKGKICIEIGFGKGNFLENYAKTYRENIIGIEISEYSLRNAVKKLLKFNNIRLIYAEAFFAIGHLFRKSTIDKIFILFPDPWSKKKQKKRRFLNKEFFDRACYVLKEKGEIFIITDDNTLARDLKEIISDYKNLYLGESPKEYIELAKNTKYGKKWRKLKKRFFDFFLIKRGEVKKYWKDILTGKRFDHLIIKKFDEKKFFEKVMKINIKDKGKFIGFKNLYKGEKSFILEFILKEETLLQKIFLKGKILKGRCVIKPLNRENVIFTKGLFEIIRVLSL